MAEGGSDCKTFLYGLLGKKKVTPEYSLRNSGMPTKPNYYFFFLVNPIFLDTALLRSWETSVWCSVIGAVP